MSDEDQDTEGERKTEPGWGRQKTGAKMRGNRVIVKPGDRKGSHEEINM